MKAVITVVGKDTVGILAKVAGVCAAAKVNVEVVTQSILAGTFAMIMVVEISRCNVSFDQLQQQLVPALQGAAGQQAALEQEMEALLETAPDEEKRFVEEQLAAMREYRDDYD